MADERDDKPTAPSAPTKVTIAGGGISVAVEAAEPLDTVQATAQRLHTEAHHRCVGQLPPGFGGTL